MAETYRAKVYVALLLARFNVGPGYPLHTSAQLVILLCDSVCTCRSNLMLFALYRSHISLHEECLQPSFQETRRIKMLFEE